MILQGFEFDSKLELTRYENFHIMIVIKSGLIWFKQPQDCVKYIL